MATYLPIKTTHNAKEITISYNENKHYSLKMIKKNKRMICMQKRTYDSDWNCTSLQSIDSINYDTDVNKEFFTVPELCKCKYNNGKLSEKICGDKDYAYTYYTMNDCETLIEKCNMSDDGKLHPAMYAIYGKYVYGENLTGNSGHSYIKIYPAISNEPHNDIVSEVFNNVDYSKGVVSCYNSDNNLILYSDDNVSMNYIYNDDGTIKAISKLTSIENGCEEIRIVYSYKKYTDAHYLVNPIISYHDETGTLVHRTLFYDVILNGPDCSVRQTANKAFIDTPIKFVLYSDDGQYKYEFKDYKGMKIKVSERFNFNLNTIEEQI